MSAQSEGFSIFNPMGAQQSKDELLYQRVNDGDVNGVKALHRDGAGLEWIDKEGKTPLILACMRPELQHIVKVLIGLGANVNAYHPGRRSIEELEELGYLAGTPLHHAAKCGFVNTVELLLAHGANPMLMNDDRHTALGLARVRHHWNVVHLIERRICLFSGWLREFYGSGILETIVRQWKSRKIWAVILPCDLRNSVERPKYELAIYSDLQAAQPNPVIPLWNVQIKKPAFNLPDPDLVIVDKATNKQYKFLSENKGDKQQLHLLYNACRGIPQPQHNSSFPTTPALTPMPNASQLNSHVVAPQSASEDVEPAMAIDSSIQLAIAEEVPLQETQPVTRASNFNGCGSSSENATHDSRGPSDGAPTIVVSTSAQQTSPTMPLPSAPMVEETLHYPSIDSSLIDLTAPAWEVKPRTKKAKEGGSISCPIDLTGTDSEIKPGTSEVKEGSSISGSCVICLDAPAEGACIPCGHVAGCLSCLKEIKEKKWGCPICRANIDQVIKLYAV